MHLPLISAPRRPPERPPRPRPLNVAHRGASHALPENTLAAVRRAIASDADLVEVDVQRTRDGELVLMHDRTLSRTTDVRRIYPRRAPWRVCDLTLAEVRRLDAGSWKASYHAGERIPTLTEVIETVRGTGTGLLVEVKALDLHPGLVDDLVATLRAVPGYVDEATASRRLVVQSFDFAAMKDLRTRLPHVPVGLLGRPDPANLPVLATWASQVNPNHRRVSRAYVDRVHALGMSCLVWTVDSRRAMSRVLDLGVDGIITNRPDVLGRTVRRAAR